MATVIQDEARWLPEWLEYHSLEAIGFQHFYLYDDGSKDELSGVLAPFIEDDVVTLTSVQDLQPLPTEVEIERKKCDDVDAGKSKAPLVRRRADGLCVRLIQFPQQVAMVRHVVANFGNESEFMGFLDVDEFVLSSLRTPLWPLLSAKLAVNGSVYAGIRLWSTVMLPKTIDDKRPPPEGALLIRQMIRQLASPSLDPTPAWSTTKCIVRPMAIDTESYGYIHELSLYGPYKYQRATSPAVKLLHFRYRFIHTFLQRHEKNYSKEGPGAASKHTMLDTWMGVLRKAFGTRGSIVPQLGLLRHVTALQAAIHARWRRYTDHSTLPRFVFEMYRHAADAASKLGVLIVAEGRSGSTLLGEMAFDSRPDFTYMYEPCRLRARGEDPTSPGHLFNSQCAILALEAVFCGLNFDDFAKMRGDTSAFERHSTAGRLIAAEPAADVSYLLWLSRCWKTHRAAKVIRMHSFELPIKSAPPTLRIIHLVRHPMQVVASRLSLAAFTKRSPFNLLGTNAGVVVSVCSGMSAKLHPPTTANGVALNESSYITARYDELVSKAAEVVSRTFAQLGLGNRIPASVQEMIARCGFSPTVARPSPSRTRPPRRLSSSSRRSHPVRSEPNEDLHIGKRPSSSRTAPQRRSSSDRSKPLSSLMQRAHSAPKERPSRSSAQHPAPSGSAGLGSPGSALGRTATRERLALGHVGKREGKPSGGGSKGHWQPREDMSRYQVCGRQPKVMLPAGVRPSSAVKLNKTLQELVHAECADVFSFYSFDKLPP